MMTLNSIFGKLLPEILEFSIILLDVVWIINDNNIFLIALAGLDSPVEGSGDQVRVVNNNEFIVHVKLRTIICPHRDTLLMQPMNITALVGHALIVRY